MTIKRAILILLTIFAIVRVALSLVESWGQPQIQSRLELYQTNLLLHGAEFKPEGADEIETARNALIGDAPFKNAQKQYTEARSDAQTSFEKVKEQFSQTSPDTPNSALQQQQLQVSMAQIQQLLNELDLRLGILQVKQGETATALKTWEGLTTPSTLEPISRTAAVLTGLWTNPPRLLPESEEQIRKNLDSWFRYQALSRLYAVQQRQEALSTLQVQEQKIAEQAAVKLAIIAGIPGIGLIFGSGLLVFLLVQLLLQGKRSLLAQNAATPWETPWDGEIVWQVLIVGFFFVGQFILPLLLGVSGLNPAGYDIRGKAFFVLFSYILLAAGGLGVLYFSLKPFLPLPEGWFKVDFKGNWALWGFGGYLVALPLVIVVSLINQQLWQGQGGSNPILPLVLQGRDSLALTIFFVTASIAAPVFEEIIFRGFLLPSLTRYVPVWSAIALSSLLFAVAHLSLSEVLPLATLGTVLGIVYTRSRNLFAPMLLHSLWNGGTLLSLFVLGSSNI